MTHTNHVVKAFLAAGCFGAMTCAPALAVDDLSALRLEIGPYYDQVPASSSLFSTIEGSAAIGAYNQVYAPRSMTIGEQNAIYATDALSLGFWNITGDATISGGDCSLTVGYLNTNLGVHCAVIGGHNYLSGWGTNPAAALSIVVGDSNTFKGNCSLVVGYNNYLDSGVYNGGAIGQGLISATGNALVVGQYNRTWNFNDPAGDKPVFIVANGADNETRHNALEVHYDGKVVISKAQGDILMGEFGNP